MTSPTPLLGAELRHAEPAEWTEQRALDEKPPPQPVKIPLGWRIVGWICEALFSFGGG